MKLEKKYLGLMTVIAGAVCSTSAMAQSSVTMFGTIDSGITYVSNAGGKQLLMMDDGVDGPNLWGLRGKEDLGNGTQATFELVDQFHVDTGSFMTNGSLFTRGATIGLQNDRYGKLTIGNQYDFMTDSLFFGGDEPGEMSGHFYAFRNGPFDKLDLPNNPTGAFDWDRMAGEVVSNSVKYVSPTFNGFSAGSMYVFGNTAGSVGAGNGSSFALNYKQQNFGFNAAYTNLKYTSASTSVRNWGLGAHYDTDAWKFAALFTTVHNSVNGGSVYEGSVGADYYFTTAVSAGASYMYMKGNAVVDSNHANELAANVMYHFSKRTEVYLMGIYQRANAGANAQINGIMNSSENYASSGDTQFVARAGLRVRF